MAKGRCRLQLTILLPAFCLMTILWNWTSSSKLQEPLQPLTLGGRELLSVASSNEWNCVRPAIEEFPDDIFTQEQRLRGGIVLHFLLTIYLCATLGFICESYFVPALEVLSEVLKIPTDVAGATFMAIGTSAPELFSSVIGAFLIEGDIGVGAIVGSAVFNVIGITGIAGLTVWNQSVSVDWFPITRDCLAYTLSILALILVLLDSIVTWYEAVILLVMFVAYIVVMVYNGKIQDFSLDKMSQLKAMLQHSQFTDEEKKCLLEKSSSHVVIKIPSEPLTLQFSQGTEEEQPYSLWKPPSGYVRCVAWLLMWPAAFLLFATIPDCRQERYRRFYLLTFAMSVLWIAAITYLSVWMVTLIGFTFGIPDSIAGLTILAIGTSVPEIMSSIIVVRQGLGNMAICNLIGSNVFNIVFCLGAPWLIKTLLSPSKSIAIQSAALTYTTLTLLSTVFLLYVSFILTGWRLNKNLGIICLIMYVGFIGLACFYELELLHDYSLPSCSRSIL